MDKKNIFEELNKLVNKIKQQFITEDIILFGSYAHGNPTENSDIDLCIIIGKNNLRKIEILKEIRRSLIKITTKSIDILVYDKDEFMERSALKSTFEYKIKNEGVKVG